MGDGADELDDLRLDVETLRALIDLALDNGAGGDDVILKAFADVLYERRSRLEEIEHAIRWTNEERVRDELG